MPTAAIEPVPINCIELVGIDDDRLILKIKRRRVITEPSNGIRSNNLQSISEPSRARPFSLDRVWETHLAETPFIVQIGDERVNAHYEPPAIKN